MSRVILRRSRRISKTAQDRPFDGLRTGPSDESLSDLRSFTELVLRLFAEFTLSTFGSLSVDSANVLRMTQREGFRVTVERLGSVNVGNATVAR